MRLALAAKLFAGALLAVWTVDVLLSMALVEKIGSGGQFQARIGDFLGLCIAEAPMVLAIALVSWVAGPLVARLSIVRGRASASVALLCAGLVGLTVTCWLSWPFTASAIRTSLLVAVFASLATLLILRARFARRRDDAWGFGEVSLYALYSPLILGFSVSAVALLWRGSGQAGLLNSAVTVLLVATVVLAVRKPRSVFVRSVSWMPFLLAVAVSGYLCRASSSHGGPPPGGDLAGPATARSNIVLIVLDTVRADHLARYGYSRVTMPALERWADRAVNFERAISAAGWTAPAHASIFSGRTVSEHGLHYESEPALPNAPLHTRAFEGVSWLPERLADSGYRSVAVTANRLAVPPDIRGFDRVYAPHRSRWNARSIGALTDRVLPVSGRNSERLGWRLPYVDAKGIVDLVTGSSLDSREPLFLFVNLVDAHSPYNPPTAALRSLGLHPTHTLGRYQGHHEFTRMWPSLPEESEQELDDLYDGELRWMDFHLDRLLRWIEQRLGSDTVVIVTSDHGEELGEHGRVGHEFGLSQTLIHVPLMIRGPRLKAGTVAEVVSTRRLFDFIMGIAVDGEADTTRLLPTDEYGLISERYPSGHNSDALGPGYDRAWVSLIGDDLKAVGPPDQGWELFDLSASGFSREEEVFGADGEEALRERIQEYWDAFRDQRSPLDDHEGLSPEEIERLRGLGYIR